MSSQNGKKVLALMGVFEGHITGIVEIIKDLTTLGHSVTCYVLDKYKDRLENTNAKQKVFSLPPIKMDPNFPKRGINAFIIGYSYDAILTDAVKSEEKYDYLLIDSFFDGNEINKIFKIPTIISAYVFPCGEVIPYVKQFAEARMISIKSVNQKFNLNIRDFISVHYIGDSKYKLMLTSKLFHPKSKILDDSFFFIGPSLDERPVEHNFNFKKDENKKLIYMSLGTIYNEDINVFKKCVEAFKNSKDFQVLISLGSYFDIKDLGDLPENISVYNYVPQTQILKQTDIFITHGGMNSINEAIYMNNKSLILIPQQLDQFENAKQVENFEAGIVLDAKTITPEVFKNAVNKYIENEEKYKIGVAKIAKSFKEAREDRKKILEKLFV